MNKESMSQGLKPGWLQVLDVRAKARTYLRSHNKDNGRGHFNVLDKLQLDSTP